MSDDESGSVIDDKGRLFGIVNIVDLLVVIFMLAVIVGGVALVTSDTGTLSSGQDAENETETRYVTIDLSSESVFIANQVSPGDTVNTSNPDEQLRITDTYQSGNQRTKETTIVARAKITGTVGENETQSVVQYQNAPLRIGRGLSIATDSYQVAGQIISVSETGENLSVTDLDVRVEGIISSAVANAISSGDQYRVGGETVGTVRSVSTEAANETDRTRVAVDLTLTVFDDGNGREFAGRPVRIGRMVSFQTEMYQFRGEITSVSQ